MKANVKKMKYTKGNESLEWDGCELEYTSEEFVEVIHSMPALMQVFAEAIQNAAQAQK